MTDVERKGVSLKKDPEQDFTSRCHIFQTLIIYRFRCSVGALSLNLWTPNLAIPSHGCVDLPETGQGIRSWILIDASGNSQVIEIDKLSIIGCYGISARDLRILDPIFVYPTTILGREKAIVANLEKIRCIVTADQVLVLNSLDKNVSQYVRELQKRLTSTGVAELKPWGSNTRSFRSPSSHSPFEFRALAVALEVFSGSLDFEASEIEIEAYPLLDELTSEVSSFNLERVRRLKSRLVALSRRIHKIRDEIEKIMDDSEGMGEMYLTEKKRKMMESSLNSSSCDNDKSDGKSLEELESLLEAYFVVIDTILSKLITLKEYIDDTENFINIHMNNVRNRLIQFELLLTTATFVLTIFGIVIGIFGINFPVPLFKDSHTIKLILVITSICAFIIYSAFVCFFKWRKLLFL
ncbi:hypothetical protein PTKIN_Ptkin18bG0030400 [Pterospermum kingtungense]